MPPVTLVWSYGTLAVLLVAAAVTDVVRGKIYNALTYPAIAIGLIGHTLGGGWRGTDMAPGLTWALLGFATGFVPLLVAYLAGGVGGGDAKLMGAVGALAGWRFTLSALFFGFAVTAVMAIVVMVRRRVVRRTLRRVGRFLLLAANPRGVTDPASADSPKVPMGLAFSIGSAAALAEALLQGSAAAKWILGI